jgi:hypothetical protein
MALGSLITIIGDNGSIGSIAHEVLTPARLRPDFGRLHSKVRVF